MSHGTAAFHLGFEVQDDRKRQRAEARQAVDTIQELIAMGVVPRSVTIGDTKIEVASYQAPTDRSPSDELVTPRRGGHLNRLADRMAAKAAARVAAAKAAGN